MEGSRVCKVGGMMGVWRRMEKRGKELGVEVGEDMEWEVGDVRVRGEMVEGKLGLWYMGMRGLGRE